MRKRPHFLNKIPIFSSNWGSEIGSKYANFSDFWALSLDPETTSLLTNEEVKRTAQSILVGAIYPLGKHLESAADEDDEEDGKDNNDTEEDDNIDEVNGDEEDGGDGENNGDDKRRCGR